MVTGVCRLYTILSRNGELTTMNTSNASDNSNAKKNTNNKNTASKEPKKITSKQVVAMAGIVLLVLLYVVTLLVAIFDSSASGRLFQACLFATVAVPLLCWIYTWMYGIFAKKHTIADFDLNGDPTKH